MKTFHFKQFFSVFFAEFKSGYIAARMTCHQYHDHENYQSPDSRFDVDQLRLNDDNWGLKLWENELIVVRLDSHSKLL